MTELDERLKRLRDSCREMRETLEAKIASVRKERDEMLAEYDREISAYENDLKSLGVRPIDIPSEVGVKALNYLLANAGRKFYGGQIMEAINEQDATAGVVLRPFIDNGRIQTEGSYRSKMYWIKDQERAEDAT